MSAEWLLRIPQLDVLLEKRVRDLAKLEDTDAASGLEDAESLREDRRQRGAVTDTKRDGVEVDRVVLDVLGEVLRVALGEGDLGSWPVSCWV